MRRPNAFTLIELLVVIGIITVLISLLLPALNKARTQARMVSELSNARQFATAMIMYANDNRGYWPSARRFGFNQDDYAQYPVASSAATPVIRGWEPLTRYGIGVSYSGPEAGRNTWAIANKTRLAKNSVACHVWQDHSDQSPSGWPLPGFKFDANGNTEMHWNVYVGRSDAYHFFPHTTPAVYYRSPTKMGDNPRDSSRTMIMCRHYLTTQSWGGWLPHTGGLSTIRSMGQAINPTADMKPSGLVVGSIDGSARLAQLGELQRLTIARRDAPDTSAPLAQSFIYYDPVR